MCLDRKILHSRELSGCYSVFKERMLIEIWLQSWKSESREIDGDPAREATLKLLAVAERHPEVLLASEIERS